MSDEPFTEYLTNQLEEIERNWNLDPARLQKMQLAVQREIDIAESLISDAEHPVKLLVYDPACEAARQKFFNALDSAERILANAWHEIQIATELKRNHARLAGLNKVNLDRQKCRAKARFEAQKLWKLDHEQKIRLGDMCEEVWGLLISEYSQCLPDKPNGMKSWLREIAPPYAQRPGRPKK